MLHSSVVEALRWVARLLRNAGDEHQLAGGLAARAYGATRPLADIDFYVSRRTLETALPAARAHVTHGPRHVQTDEWDLIFATLDYAGRQIEFGVAENARYFDRRADRWRGAAIDFAASVEKEIAGVRVPVMPRAQLIRYKTRLARAVDRQDVRQMHAATP